MLITLRCIFFSAFALFIHNTVLGQVDFSKANSQTSLFQKARSADSAITAGEFGGVHSLLIVKEGKLVFEGYYNGWKKDSVHQLQSATKSVISTLLGCAIQQGFITDENEPLSKYFSIDATDSLKQKIILKDLLTQRHGLRWKEGAWEDPNNTWRKVLNTEGNWYEEILKTPMDTTPGTVFTYSNAAPVLITGVIQKASRMDIDSFAYTYLFNPLGIKNCWFWPGNGGPENNGMALISLTSRDMAKIGQLYLQDGKWNNSVVLPKSYIQAATASHVKAVEPNGIYSNYDYGYFWWSNPKPYNSERVNIYLARGAGGQNIIVDKKNNTVVIITAWNMQQPNKPQAIYDRYLY